MRNYNTTNKDLIFICPEFLAEAAVSKVRFKAIKVGYLSNISIHRSLIDLVPNELFWIPEPLRLPLFFGSSISGIYPEHSKARQYIDDGHDYAIFYKSVLSGREGGLKIRFNHVEYGRFWTIHPLDIQMRHKHNPDYPFLSSGNS
jgi:hypothetical protein